MQEYLIEARKTDKKNVNYNIEVEIYAKNNI